MAIEVELPDGRIAEFPDSMSPDEIQAVLRRQFGPPSRPSQPAAQAHQSRPIGRSGEASRRLRGRRAEREAFLSGLEQTNPFQAQALREMPGYQQAAVQVGAGLRDIGRGLGLIDRPMARRQPGRAAGPREPQVRVDPNEEFIQQLDPATTGARTVGQALPFLPAAVAATPASLPLRAGLQAGVGATEGAVVARGTGGDAADILTGAVTGGLIGGGVEVIGPIISRNARALIQKVTGKPPRGILIDDAGRPTRELQRALDESGESFDDLVREASREAQGESVERVVTAGRADDFERAAPDFEVDPDRLAAAERVGVAETAPIAVLTEDQAAQELAGALAAVQRSRQSSQLDAFTEELGGLADDYVRSIGGGVDRGLIDDDLLGAITSDINRIKALENKLYEPIDEAIGAGTEINDYAGALKNKLSARARDVGGIKKLRKHERDLLEELSSKDGMTYQRFKDVMSDIGAAAYRQTRAYDDVDTALLKETYSDLTRVRENIADTFGVGNQMQRAKRLGQERFGLQEASQSLFGQNLEKSIFPKIDRSIKGLEKGSVREFRATMESIPAKHRKAVAATMLNTALTGGGQQRTGINSTKFSRWYNNIKNQPSAMKALKQYVGEDEINRLDDFAKLASGVSGVLKGRVRTGITPEALRRLDDPNQVASKLYSVARAVEGATGSNVAAAPIGNVAGLLQFDKTPAVEAADQLLSSTQFRKAVIEAAKSGVDSQKFRQLNNRLKSSPVYKNYINQLDQTTASAVASAGLIPWLASEEDEQ